MFKTNLGGVSVRDRTSCEPADQFRVGRGIPRGREVPPARDLGVTDGQELLAARGDEPFACQVGTRRLAPQALGFGPAAMVLRLPSSSAAGNRAHGATAQRWGAVLIEGTATQTSEPGGRELGNLPIQLTRLVGRGAALASSGRSCGAPVCSLCAGPAVRASRASRLRSPRAVQPDVVGAAWWVDPSSTFESDLVPQVVAATVLQSELTSDPAPAALAHPFPIPRRGRGP